MNWYMERIIKPAVKRIFGNQGDFGGFRKS